MPPAPALPVLECRLQAGIVPITCGKDYGAQKVSAPIWIQPNAKVAFIKVRTLQNRWEILTKDAIKTSTKVVLLKVGGRIKAHPKDAIKIQTRTKDTIKIRTHTKDAIKIRTRTKDTIKIKTQTKDATKIKTRTKDAIKIKTQTKDAIKIKTKTKDATKIKTRTKDATKIKTRTKEALLQWSFRRPRRLLPLRVWCPSCSPSTLPLPSTRCLLEEQRLFRVAADAAAEEAAKEAAEAKASQERIILNLLVEAAAVERLARTAAAGQATETAPQECGSPTAGDPWGRRPRRCPLGVAGDVGRF